MGLMVLEEKIFYVFFFHYKSMGVMTPPPPGRDHLGPQGLDGRIYARDH